MDHGIGIGFTDDVVELFRLCDDVAVTELVRVGVQEGIGVCNVDTYCVIDIAAHADEGTAEETAGTGDQDRLFHDVHSFVDKNDSCG